MTSSAPRQVPLSFGQRRLWIAEQAAPGSLAFTTPLLLRWRGALDTGVLRSCLDEVVRRHEVLRTTFVTERGVPTQLIGEFRGAELDVVDCRGSGADSVDLAVQQELTRPFDLVHGPLFRARVVLADDDAGLLVLNLHHIVTDGWSGGVLQDELIALYPALAAGGGSPLPELPLQYADFAVQQQESLTPQRRTELVEHWRERLAGAPAYSSLPYDRAPTGVDSGEGHTVSFSLEPTVVAGVRALARAESSTVFMVLLAAYKVVLSRLTGATDVLVATSVAGRNDVRLDGLIGFFVNNVVLRTDLSGERSFREVLRRVRQTVLDAQDHQDLPFDLLVSALRPPRQPSRTPFLQTSLTHQPESITEYHLGDVAVQPIPAPVPAAPLDLTVSFFEDAGIAMQINYRVELFTPDTISNLGEQFSATLRAGVAEDVGTGPRNAAHQAHPAVEFGSGPLAEVDLTSPRVHAERDLGDVWDLLREQQPVAWHPTPDGGFWVVSSYAAAAEVYRTSDVFSSGRGNVLATLLTGGDPAGGKMLPVSDGPRHQQIRRILLRALTPRALTGIAERIRDATLRLVREAVVRGDCDLGREVAPHIPLAAICDLLMVPESDRELLLRQSKLALAAEGPDGTELDARLARNEILLYFAKLARTRRDSPGDDILGLMIQLTRSPIALTDQELLYNAYSLLLGGDETTRLSMIGTVHALTQWPDEWKRLRAGEVSVESAVEEFLRWTTPTLHAGRVATQDTTLGGRAIARGDIVTVWNSSANFDPKQFDDPARLQLTRSPNRHLTFAVGPHFCLGAQLARVELHALLTALVATTDDITLVGPPKRLYSNFLSGFHTMPVRFSSAGNPRPTGPADKDEVR